ncbi:endopeptidase, family M22 [Fervidicoccus fontis Kam940]|uniref:tRNA N6-adenosine threonylcarbamoyltransferase n=1 Tax=Fervidicoccus fontis (strain DSM 19380 / JCM 18336 / VKM B-2539 / Kam940) TaxID=1163730 RepID=I0A2W4_FERFK|nr:KEOPS complex N(6)-L-threonylcarbamoyladenine synthase Kae1 [Fervidicoccus fontis]AFH43321.1 endopeptidase, family M22 [Fervidicoccus fontis Kam940]
MRIHGVLGEEKLIRVLGIESTAHTIGVGIAQNREPHILANEKDKYEPEKGGIHPRDASRHHAEKIGSIISRALKKANLKIDDIDAVAVALGPGMGPCLRVGATAARAISSYFGKPLIPVNHAIAHIEIGNLLSGFSDPLVVYISGGNTSIIAYKQKRYRVFGETQDIALGNLIDTFAREAGLAPPYVVNGRHVVELCAERSKEKKLLDLPYIVKGQDVSYGGLLTSSLKMIGKEDLGDVCYSLVEISYSMITEVAERGLAHTRKKEVILTGGVSASKVLTEKLEKMSALHGAKFFSVPPAFAGDNGAMIAWTGLLEYVHGIIIDPSMAYISQRWRVEEVEVVWKE